MRIDFSKKLFEPKQLYQRVVYQTPISCFTWSKQLKFSQIALLAQKAVVTKHPRYVLDSSSRLQKAMFFLPLLT